MINSVEQPNIEAHTHCLSFDWSDPISPDSTPNLVQNLLGRRHSLSEVSKLRRTCHALLIFRILGHGVAYVYISVEVKLLAPRDMCPTYPWLPFLPTPAPDWQCKQGSTNTDWLTTDVEWKWKLVLSRVKSKRDDAECVATDWHRCSSERASEWVSCAHASCCLELLPKERTNELTTAASSCSQNAFYFLILFHSFIYLKESTFQLALQATIWITRYHCWNQSVPVVTRDHNIY